MPTRIHAHMHTCPHVYTGAAECLSELALLRANRLAIDRAGGISPLVALLCTPSSPKKKHTSSASRSDLDLSDDVDSGL